MTNRKVFVYLHLNLQPKAKEYRKTFICIVEFTVMAVISLVFVNENIYETTRFREDSSHLEEMKKETEVSLYIVVAQVTRLLAQSVC